MGSVKKIMRAGVLACLFAGASAMAMSAETLNDALSWAYKNNPAINSVRAQVRSAFESIEQAKAGKRPTFDLDLSYLATNSEDGLGGRVTNDVAQAQLTASLLLWDGGQTDMAIETARANVKSAEASLLAAEQQLLYQTVGAYVDVIQAEENVKLQRSNSAILDKQVQTATIAFDEGATTLAELSATKATAASARAQIALADANLAAAQQAYKVLTGRAPGELSSVKSPKIPSSSEAVEAEALKSSPSVFAALETERAAQYNLRRAQRNSSVTVSAQAKATRQSNLEDTPVDSASVGVYVNVPLYTGGRNPSLERQARAQLEQRSAETNEARASATQAAANAWAQYQNTIATAAAYRKVVEAQKVANEGAEIEFELGANTIVDKLNAEQDLLEARTNLLSANFAEVKAAYGVLAAMGKMGINNLAPSVQKINPIAPVAATVAPPKSKNEIAVEVLSDRWSKPAE